MHVLDSLLQKQFPVVVAPKFSDFEPLATPGDRFVVAEQGLLLETRRAWVHAVSPVQGGPMLRPVPFGAGPAVGVRLLCGALPAEMERRFIDRARRALPNECACWITWNEHTRTFAYRDVQVLEHSPARIRYTRPNLEDGEHLVADIHSHGLFAAGFSKDDEADDRGTLQLSIVYGNLDQGVVSKAVVMRCLGVTLPQELISIGDF